MRLITDEVLATLVIWQESRGEPYTGKVGVAEVLRNRTKLKYMSDGTMAGTVLWKQQFSGMNAGDPNRIPSFKLDDQDRVVQECFRAWEDACSWGCSLFECETDKGSSWWYTTTMGG